MISAEDARPGFFRFLHHDQPIEWSRDVINRIEYIQTQKPLKEIPGRLAAICRVPDEMISPRLWKAAQACGEARRAEWPDRGLALALSLGPLPAGVTWDANNTCLSFA